jgi:8-hydroxy-5-deazaflavin:NADPH oxidoreductase
MNVTIIGAGNMGKGIGYRMVVGGHSVTVVDQNPEAAENLASELKTIARKGASVSVSSLETVQPGDVVVLAVWYGVNKEVVQKLGSRLNGKVVVDIANPLNATFDGLATPPDSSSAEELAKVVPAGVKVVKAFNTTFAGTLLSGSVAGLPLDVFIAGDDAEAKQKVSQLVTDGGMRAIDAGPLHRSRQIEGMQLLQIVLQGSLGTNWMSGLKIVS